MLHFGATSFTVKKNGESHLRHALTQVEAGINPTCKSLLLPVFTEDNANDTVTLTFNPESKPEAKASESFGATIMCFSEFQNPNLKFVNFESTLDDEGVQAFMLSPKAVTHDGERVVFKNGEYVPK